VDAGSCSLVKRLFSQGALVNINECGYRILPHLHRAAEKGDMDMVVLLLKYGADVNRNEKGTALVAAAQNGHERVVRCLIDNGAEIVPFETFTHYDLGNNYLYTETGSLNRVNVMELLFNKTDLEVLLMIAALHGWTDILDQILDRGIDINRKLRGIRILDFFKENAFTMLGYYSRDTYRDRLFALMDRGAKLEQDGLEEPPQIPGFLLDMEDPSYDGLAAATLVEYRLLKGGRICGMERYNEDTPLIIAPRMMRLLEAYDAVEDAFCLRGVEEVRYNDPNLLAITEI
jgi:hypothetical protein